MTLGGKFFTLRFWAACLILLLLLPQSGYAQPVMVGDIRVDPKDFAPDRDPQTRIAACLACHGEHAGGDIDFGPDVRFGTPALRGLDESYLKQSLQDYKTGSRPHEEMQVIASMLNDETIDFMARSFAAYPAPPLKTADELSALAETDLGFRKGQAISQDGLPEKDVPACVSCHGEMGEGIADIGPHLAGQNSLYIQQQLKAYANQVRSTEQAEIMQPIAVGLSDDEIEAVAHYYEHLVDTDQQ